MPRIFLIGPRIFDVSMVVDRRILEFGESDSFFSMVVLGKHVWNDQEVVGFFCARFPFGLCFVESIRLDFCRWKGRWLLLFGSKLDFLNYWFRIVEGS